MPDRSRKKRPKDVNELAAQIVAEATGQSAPKPARKVAARKNPAAVALGRRGGLKGGKARADALTPERRAEIARRAALARWKDKPKGQ